MLIAGHFKIDCFLLLVLSDVPMFCIFEPVILIVIWTESISLMTKAIALVIIFQMRAIFCFFIFLNLCACSNLRPKESCTDSNGWNYQAANSEEQDYKNLKDRCEVQHGITIDREKYSKFRQEKATESLKKDCTCESGFTGQSAHQYPNDPKQKEWAEKCKIVAMDKEYLRGIELAKSSLAKNKTEEEMRKTQSISREMAQLFCKKN